MNNYILILAYYSFNSNILYFKVEAMEWFRLAAQQGHPKSSYNLAIGHLSGMKTNLEVYISNSINSFFVVTEQQKLIRK